MAAAREGDAQGAVLGGLDPRAHRGADLAAVGVGAQGGVQPRQHRSRRALVHRGRAHRVARQRRDRGRLRALAGDVADDDHPPVADAEDVVEVAADLARLAGGAEARGGRDAGDDRQPRRQQAALQRGGDVRARRVQARVLDRDAGAAPELAGERQLAPAQPSRAVRGAHGHDADDAIAGGHRDDHGRARAARRAASPPAARRRRPRRARPPRRRRRSGPRARCAGRGPASRGRRGPSTPRRACPRARRGRPRRRGGRRAARRRARRACRRSTSRPARAPPRRRPCPA